MKIVSYNFYSLIAVNSKIVKTCKKSESINMNMFSTALQQSVFKVSVENDSLGKTGFLFSFTGNK